MILPHSAEPTNTVPGLRLLLDYHAQTGDIEVMDVKEPHHYTEKFGRKSVFKVAHDGPFKAEFVDEPNFVKRTAGESYKRSVFQSEGPKATFTPPAVGLWHIIIHLPQETAKKLHVQFFE